MYMSSCVCCGVCGMLSRFLTHTRTCTHYSDDMEGMPNVLPVAFEPLILWIDPDYVQEEGADPPHKVEVVIY